MVMTAHCKHPEEVHAQTERTDEQQLAGVHLRGLQPEHECQVQNVHVVRFHLQTLDGLENDEDGNEDEEDPVSEAGERLYPSVADHRFCERRPRLFGYPTYP